LGKHAYFNIISTQNLEFSYADTSAESADYFMSGEVLGSLTGTSALDIAALIFQAGVSQGSSTVSLSMWIKFLPVVDLTHLPLMLATTLTSELLLFCRQRKKFTNLPTSFQPVSNQFVASSPSTRNVWVDLGRSQASLTV
jgi:hypothetical protein